MTPERQLIQVLGNIPRRKSRAAIDLTNKRVDLLIAALEVADAGVVQALEDLLQYTGGWDLKNPDHPIAKAIAVRNKLIAAGLLP